MKKAEIILKSSNIFTGSGDKTISGIISIADNKIQYVGSEDLINELKDDNTKIIDCGEKLIIPGLHDAHLHFYFSALYRSPFVHVSLTDTSEQQCIDGLAQLASKVSKDRWLIGAGWYHPIWDNPVLPSKKSLDEVYPDRPVCMVSGDCHTLWVNSYGLKLLGIDKNSVPPKGGAYDKDENGELTGIIHESAAAVLLSKVYDFTKEETDAFFINFIKTLNSYGITSICDMSTAVVPGTCFVRDDVYETLLNEDKLNLRVHMFPTLREDLSRPRELREKFTGSMLRCTGVKQFLDGVSSCHTAYLKEPYSNAYFEGDVGKTTIEPELMRKLILLAAENDFSVRVHTIGDQAIHLLLDYFEEAERKLGKKHHLQHTLEHVENFQKDDIARLSKLNVIPSVQPAHAMIDPNGVERDLGSERIHLMWPFRQLLDAGSTLAFGTDCPVADINPFDSIYNAITRQSAFTREPKGGWIPAEKITPYEAVRAYTYGSACAVHRQHEIGTLAPGMFADIAVLDNNILEENPEVIPKTSVVMTIVNGKVVYEK